MNEEFEIKAGYQERIYFATEWDRKFPALTWLKHDHRLWRIAYSKASCVEYFSAWILRQEIKKKYRTLHTLAKNPFYQQAF